MWVLICLNWKVYIFYLYLHEWTGFLYSTESNINMCLLGLKTFQGIAYVPVWYDATMATAQAPLVELSESLVAELCLLHTVCQMCFLSLIDSDRLFLVSQLIDFKISVYCSSLQAVILDHIACVIIYLFERLMCDWNHSITTVIVLSLYVMSILAIAYIPSVQMKIAAS